jgi:hypothetical protein
MYEHANLYWQLHTQGIIEPARWQILEEHRPRVRDFGNIVSSSPFIPAGREHLYAMGLHAGLVGDFATAAHFLIPQLENSIRQLIYQHGGIASGLSNEGIQPEYDLNTILKKNNELATMLNGILGEDTVFDLRGIFVEQSGANLRNEMAHGLIDSHHFYQTTVRYAWWLILRLCCLPIIHRLNDHNPGESSEESE